MAYGVIYKSTCKITGKSYVGKAVDFEKRKSFHLKSINWKVNSLPKFYPALKKYGSQNFEWFIIESCCSKDQLQDREIAWIKELDTFKNGYNCTPGGDGAIHYGKDNGMFGKKHPQEWRDNHSKTMTGRKFSIEHRRKMSLWQKGSKRSSEQKAKLSATMLRLHAAGEVKGMVGIKNPMAKLNGKSVKEIRDKYKRGGHTQMRLSEIYGVSRQHISLVLSRKVWTSI